MDDIILFETIDKTKEQFNLKINHNVENIIIDFGDLSLNPQFLNLMLEIQRISEINKKNVYFLNENEEFLRFLMIHGYKKYFNVLKNMTEYENRKKYADKKIYIYDDNAYSIDLIEDTLRKEGFSVISKNEEEFINFESNNMDDFRMFIVDVNTNIEIKTEKIKYIKDNFKNISIILLVNEGRTEITLNTIKYGVDEVVVKPFKRYEFINIINRIVLEYDLKKENQRLIDEIIKRESEISKLYSNLETELQLASDIQRNIMPSKVNKFKNYEIEYLFEPSQNIGGDFCDIIELSDSKVAVIFADISGHGIPASLLSSMLKVYIMNYAHQVQKTNELLDLINEEIIKVFPKGKFVSAFYLIIDLNENTMRYCKASQENGLFFKNDINEILELKTEGQILGLFSKKIFPDIINFEEKEIKFEENDRLILYTDGIIEAKNDQEEYYGLDRLKNIISENMNRKSILEIIRNDLEKFVNSKKLEDDLTLMTIYRVKE